MTYSELKPYALKLFDHVTSVKFYVLAVATFFFYTRELSETGFIQLVLATTALRTVNEVTAMVKESKRAP